MSGELVSSPHETLEELEEDAGARTCFPIARSYELGAGKLSPRDTAEAIKHAEPSLALFIAFTPFLRKGGGGVGEEAVRRAGIFLYLFRRLVGRAYKLPAPSSKL